MSAHTQLASRRAKRSRKRGGERARLDLRLVRSAQPAGALRREARRNDAARGGAEPLGREPDPSMELVLVPDRFELVAVECDVERARALVTDVEPGDVGELGGEGGVEAGRALCERRERLPSRLHVRVRRENAGRRVRRTAAGLLALEDADLEAPLSRTPPAREPDHAASDDDDVEALVLVQAIHLLPAPA